MRYSLVENKNLSFASKSVQTCVLHSSLLNIKLATRIKLTMYSHSSAYIPSFGNGEERRWTETLETWDAEKTVTIFVQRQVQFRLMRMHKHIMNWVSSCDITGAKLWNGANTATAFEFKHLPWTERSTAWEFWSRSLHNFVVAAGVIL